MLLTFSFLSVLSSTNFAASSTTQIRFVSASVAYSTTCALNSASVCSRLVSSQNTLFRTAGVTLLTSLLCSDYGVAFRKIEFIAHILYKRLSWQQLRGCSCAPRPPLAGFLSLAPFLATQFTYKQRMTTLCLPSVVVALGRFRALPTRQLSLSGPGNNINPVVWASPVLTIQIRIYPFLLSF